MEIQQHYRTVINGKVHSDWPVSDISNSYTQQVFCLQMTSATVTATDRTSQTGNESCGNGSR